MNKTSKQPLENSTYTDGFPAKDNMTKKENIESRDPSRPFDSGRKKEVKPKYDKDYNPTGTTLNEKDKYKK